MKERFCDKCGKPFTGAYKEHLCQTCLVDLGWDSTPMTNADRIRAMTDEELAKFIPDWSYTNACKCDQEIYVDCNNECDKCVLEWLKQPAEADHG